MSLIKHSGWNIFGAIIPSIIAIPTMGIMARKMGIESFGLFTLLFALVGYASIFDVGISRAVTRMIAIERGNKHKIISIMGTSSWAILSFSLCGMIILFLLSEHITVWLQVSDKNYQDTLLSLRIMAFSIPLFLLTQVWLGYLEGLEKFSVINIQKIFTSSILAILPLTFLFINNNLSYAIIGLVIARLLTCLIVFIITKRYIQSLFSSFNLSILKELLSFGGWLTASNIISPLMVYFDRFILSNISGADTVAQYTAPSDLVNRLSIFPAGIAKALFPKLSRESDAYTQGLILLAITSLIVIIPFFIFSEWILVTWLGSEYAGTPATVLQILLIGFFFNSLAQAPFAAIQAKGYAKITAYVHMSELIPYLISLVILIHYFGLIGIAIAWTLRVTIDFLILFCIKKRL